VKGGEWGERKKGRGRNQEIERKGGEAEGGMRRNHGGQGEG